MGLGARVEPRGSPHFGRVSRNYSVFILDLNAARQ